MEMPEVTIIARGGNKKAGRGRLLQSDFKYGPKVILPKISEDIPDMGINP
jgi:hypothetical protein